MDISGTNTMLVILDTETNGLPSYSYPDTRMTSEWPRMVSVAWKLVSSNPTPPPTDIIVKPTDFQITEGSAKVHGITQDKAMKEGKPIHTVLGAIAKALTADDKDEKVVVCCYNSQFDLGIIESEAHRHQHSELLQKINECEWHCLMMHTQRVLNTPNFIKLAEAVQKLGGPKALENIQLHTAAGDVCATERLLRLLGAKERSARSTDTAAV